LISNIPSFQFGFLITCGLQLIFSVSEIASDKTYLPSTKEQPVTAHGTIEKVASVEDKIINDCTAVIKVHPYKANAYRERGSAYSDKGLQQKAIDDYSQAIKLEPKNFAFHEARGYIYLLQGLGEKAIADYNQAVKLTPNHYSRYWNRAIAYDYLGQEQKAIEDCNEAI
jgi:tetratricopeptide (TPR) repeat protein